MQGGSDSQPWRASTGGDKNNFSPYCLLYKRTSLIDIITGIIDAVYAAAELVGLPVLFVVFVLKGALIGKIFPTTVFLPGYVIAVGARGLSALVIAIVTAIGYVVGQYVVFAGIRREGVSFTARLPLTASPDPERMEQLDALFHRWGGLSIFLTNFVPWIRGLATIPAAMTSYNRTRYLAYTISSTVLYHLLYVLIALGALELLAPLIER